jgi:hypothetical protein
MPPGSSATIIMSCFFEEGLEAKKKYLEAILFYALFSNSFAENFLEKSDLKF